MNLKSEVKQGFPNAALWQNFYQFTIKELNENNIVRYSERFIWSI